MGGLRSFLGGAGGGALASLFPALKPFAPVISTGAGALMNKDNRLGGALQGFAGGGAGASLGSGISSGIKGLTQAGGTFGKAMEQFGTGTQSGIKNYLNAIPGMGGTFSGAGVTGGQQGALAKFFGGIGSGQRQPSVTPSVSIPSAGNTYSSGIGGAARGPVQGAMNFLSNPTTPGRTPSVTNASGIGAGASSLVANKDKTTAMDQFTGGLAKGAAGAGIGLLGDIFAPKVEVPNLAGLGADLQAQLKSGAMGDPIAKEAGMKELLARLDTPYGEVPSNAFTLGDTQNNKAMTDALVEQQRQWKALQPGVDYSNNPEFMRQQQDNIKRYNDERTMQRDQQQYEYLQQQMQQKYQYMMKALDVDQAQMEQYVQLAQLNVDQLMLEYGLSVGEAQQFKELFANMGQYAAEGMGNNQGTNMNDVLMTLAQNKGE